LSATVVLILAVAIGAVTAIFSIAHAVLIRPLPVAEPDRVMLLWGRDDARSQHVVEVSLLDQRTCRTRCRRDSSTCSAHGRGSGGPSAPRTIFVVHGRRWC